MTDLHTHSNQVEEAAAFLRQRIIEPPQIIIQLGTGLGALASAVEQAQSLDYAQIPHFPQATVTSHAGRLVWGRLRGVPVAILQGRLHYYEGYTCREVSFPIRVLSLLGAKKALITNASGGLNPALQPGDLLLLRDHINLLPDNPLRGPNVDQWGPRFPDLSAPYDAGLRHLTQACAARLGLAALHEGVYACVPGPSLETAAETRMLRLLGADCVGMSSVPEVLTALHGGLKVVGISVVANVNNPDALNPILLDDIIAAAQAAEPRLQQLILNIIDHLSL